MHPDQTSFFRHGFSSAEHTDHTALRAHFRDRLGIPAERGVPMDLIGTNGKAPEGENKLAHSRPQGLSIEPLSDLHIRRMFISFCQSSEIRVSREVGPVSKKKRIISYQSFFTAH